MEKLITETSPDAFANLIKESEESTTEVYKSGEGVAIEPVKQRPKLSKYAKWRLSSIPTTYLFYNEILIFF